VIRRRFDEAVIAELQGIRWWDWPVDKTSRNLKAITSADVEALRRAQ
jgi:virginiamycin A acetyltransferase